MLQAIIWDMDGVLADTGPAHFEAWRQVMAERGRGLTHEAFASTFGMANGEILRSWLGPNAREEEIRALADYKEARFRALVGGAVQALPGVIDWLARARERGLRQVVASSGAMANIVAVIAALGLADYFDALISGSSLPRSKPDPAIFLQAAATVGVAPAACLVIEDGIVGVEAARRAHMRCLAVTTSHPAGRLTAADLVVDSLASLSLDDLERLLA